MSANCRPKEARTGRDKQVYDDNGSRVVAGCIVSHHSRPGEVLIVSSEAKPNHWIIPKGGVESDESIEEAAVRETWEEAGADVTINWKVGVYLDTRPPKFWDASQGPSPSRSIFHIYSAELNELADVWPESSTRKRSWMTIRDAVDAMLAHERVPLAAALADYTEKLNREN